MARVSVLKAGKQGIRASRMKISRVGPDVLLFEACGHSTELESGRGAVRNFDATLSDPKTTFTQVRYSPPMTV